MKNINNIKYRDNEEDFISLLDMIYPVHSLYWSYAEVSPSELFGGTWVKIENAIVAISGKDYGDVRYCGGDWKIGELNLPINSYSLYIQTKNSASNTYTLNGPANFLTDVTVNWVEQGNSTKVHLAGSVIKPVGGGTIQSLPCMLQCMGESCLITSLEVI